jgi:hypothetical protein
VTKKGLPHHHCTLQTPFILQVQLFPYQQYQHFQIPKNLVKLLAKEFFMQDSSSTLTHFVMLP